MEGWLTQNDFTSRIGGIPEGFDITKLTPCFQQVKEGWLFDLIGQTRINDLGVWIDQQRPTNAANSELINLVTPFLVYAVWAEYIPESNVIATETGLVTKEWTDSKAIESPQIASMRRKYEDLASNWANRIKDLITVSSACNPTVLLRSPRIGKAAPRNKSAF